LQQPSLSLPSTLFQTCGEGLVKFVYLNGCINVTSEAVEDLLRAQPSIRCVDIQGCVQVYSLARSSPQIKWRNLPEALVEVPGGANALPPDLLEDQQKRREKFAKARQLRGIERILDEIRKLDEAKIFLVLVRSEASLSFVVWAYDGCVKPFYRY
jgi:hypothetical protein